MFFMTTFRSAALFLLCASVGVSTGTVAAQGTQPPAAPPKASTPATSASASKVDEVIARNIAAKGGEELLKSTQTVMWSGTMTFPTGPLRMTVWVKRPNKKRTEAERDKEKRIEAFDGTTGWVKMGSLPPQTVPPGPALENAKRQSEFDSGLVGYKERGLSIEMVGTGPVDGVYHLKSTAKDDAVMHFYIDAETGLERRTVTSLPGQRGGAAVLELRLSDYRRVEGRMVPFTVETLIDGKAMSKTQIEKIQFNLPIDDAFFQVPK